MIMQVFSIRMAVTNLTDIFLMPITTALVIKINIFMGMSASK